MRHIDRLLALEVSREMEETAKQRVDRLDEQLRSSRWRVATKLPLTAGEMRVLETFGGAR